MAYAPLKMIISPVVALPVENVDTDQIIPARFLKATDKSGFGEKLFFDWRFSPDGTPDPDFVLNQTGGEAQILLAGANFGCGSSREHAAWALYGYGFRVVISSGFADIFRNNAYNNGLLPVEVTPGELHRLFEIYRNAPEAAWSVDLPNQQLLTGRDEKPFGFAINPFRKTCLLNGQDLVDYLVERIPVVEQFENQRDNNIY